MIILFLALVVVSLINLKFSKNAFVYDNLSKSNTNSTSIKGIFAIIIFISHCLGYFATHDRLDTMASMIVSTMIGQLMVTMFFFYSGYGIMQSYVAKPNYFVSYPKNRILKTLLHFDLAVLLFFIMNIIIGKNYSVATTLLAFTGYVDIGNSNWFMFAIIITYVITYIAYLICKDKRIIVLITFVFTLVYMVVMYKVGKVSCWFDTILVFPYGLLYGIYKDKIERFITKSNKNYYIILITFCALFVGLWYGRFYFNVLQLTYNLLSIVFVSIVVLLTYKFQFNNKILTFLGVHSFSIYILQRIPMILLAKTKLIDYHLIFGIISLMITLLLSLGFDYVCAKIDNILFKKKIKQGLVEEDKKD